MTNNQEIVRNNVRDNVGLFKEELEEGDSFVVPLSSVHGGDNGVAGEHGGSGSGEDGLPAEEGGVVEVAGADEGHDAVVEVEAGASQGGGGVGERAGVGVRGRTRGVGVAAEGVERGFNSEAAFTAAAFGCGFFSGGEGECTGVEER